MPASSSSAASCQRFAWRAPGALVWASSSRRSSPGFRARAASRSNSRSCTPRYSTARGATRSSPSARAAVSARPWVSIQPMTTSLPSARLARAASSIAYVLPTPGEAPKKIFSRPRLRPSSAARRRRRASGSGRCSAIFAWVRDYKKIGGIASRWRIESPAERDEPREVRHARRPRGRGAVRAPRRRQALQPRPHPRPRPAGRPAGSRDRQLPRVLDDGLHVPYLRHRGPEGYLTRFRKLHPFITPHQSPGEGHHVADLRGLCAGFLVCYDNNLPENVRATTLMGADVIFAPHVTGGTPSSMPGRGPIDPALWDRRHDDPEALRREFDGLKGRAWLMRWLPARAWENGVYVVFSNAVGRDDDTIKPGLAMVLDPFGEVQAESRALGDDVVVTETEGREAGARPGSPLPAGAAPRAVRQAGRGASRRAGGGHGARLEGGPFVAGRVDDRSGGCLSALAPERRQVQLDGMERLGADQRRSLVRREQQPSALRQAVDLERSRHRVHEPEMQDVLAGVDRHLLRAVQPFGARRHDLAHPVRRKSEAGGVGKLRHPLAPPAGEVRHEHVVTEVQLGLEEDPPAAGTAPSVVEGRAQPGPEHRGRKRVPRGRARRHVQVPVHDLGDAVRRDLENIVVGGAALHGRCHHPSLAPPIDARRLVRCRYRSGSSAARPKKRRI